MTDFKTVQLKEAEIAWLRQIAVKIEQLAPHYGKMSLRDTIRWLALFGENELDQQLAELTKGEG